MIEVYDKQILNNPLSMLQYIGGYRDFVVEADVWLCGTTCYAEFTAMHVGF